MPDEETLQLLQELQGLQGEFKALHRAVDTAKTQARFCGVVRFFLFFVPVG